MPETEAEATLGDILKRCWAHGAERRAWFELAAARFVRSSFFEDVEAVSPSECDLQGQQLYVL